MGPEIEKAEVGKGNDVKADPVERLVILSSASLRYEDKPAKPGYYWIKNWLSSKSPRIVHVWTYTTNPNGRLFTNEDGCASVDDKELYENYKWAGPIPEPVAI